MNAKTSETAPSSKISQTNGGCCGGKKHGAQDSRGTVSDAPHDPKPGGCCGGK